jgi:plasmid maintenance system killer protein
LERLSGELAAKDSIRINRQYRMLFRWIDRMAPEVSIVAYR